MHEVDDLYQILQVHPSAEPEVIEAAYKRLALKFHPDHSSSQEAAETMKRLNRAYAVLKDPESRREYDQTRAEKVRKEPHSPPEPQGSSQQFRLYVPPSRQWRIHYPTWLETTNENGDATETVLFRGICPEGETTQIFIRIVRWMGRGVQFKQLTWQTFGAVSLETEEGWTVQSVRPVLVDGRSAHETASVHIERGWTRTELSIIQGKDAYTLVGTNQGTVNRKYEEKSLGDSIIRAILYSFTLPPFTTPSSPSSPSRPTLPTELGNYQCLECNRYLYLWGAQSHVRETGHRVRKVG